MPGEVGKRVVKLTTRFFKLEVDIFLVCWLGVWRELDYFSHYWDWLEFVVETNFFEIRTSKFSCNETIEYVHIGDVLLMRWHSRVKVFRVAPGNRLEIFEGELSMLNSTPETLAKELEAKPFRSFRYKVVKNGIKLKEELTHVHEQAYHQRNSRH